MHGPWLVFSKLAFEWQGEACVLTKNVTLNDFNCHCIPFLHEKSEQTPCFSFGMEDACSG
jgi:hypothetical protein